MTIAAGPEPFPWLTWDNYLSGEECAAAAAAWPADDWDGWHVYASPLEKKRACHLWHRLPDVCYRPLCRLQEDAPRLALLLGVRDRLVPDPGLWGAGLHSMGPGDVLTAHLDSDRHPRLGLERRVNALLFCHDRWEAGWGGELVLAGPSAGRWVEPLPGRLVLFAATGQSVHAVRPLACPGGVRRCSLATYFWGEPRGPSLRPRALFCALPGEAPDAALDALRAARTAALPWHSPPPPPPWQNEGRYREAQLQLARGEGPMAADIYEVDRSKPLGNQLLNLLERIGSDFAQLKALFAAVTQQRDGTSDVDASYVTPARVLGYLASGGAAPDTTGARARASYNELNSFIGNGGPSLEQCCARHRQ